MEDSKLYVVIGVLLIILFGLFVYLFFMGSKLHRLEKKLKEMRKNQDRT